MTKVKEEDHIASQLLTARWEGISGKLAALAQELPKEKFNYRPTEGVRDIGEILRHVAFWNQYVAATLRGETADDSANELSGAAYPNKARIIEALEKSAREALAAMQEQSPKREQATAEQAVPFIEHLCEHYGQLAVYARMLGIVPPASRG